MRVVVALGGNAIGRDGPVEEDRVVRTAEELSSLVAEGHEVVVTHGNGPQVGELLQDQEARSGRDPAPPPLPLHVLVAMTQAQVGVRLQRALAAALAAAGLAGVGVVTVVTQVRVDADDPAFETPSKPVGPRFDSRPESSHAYGRTSDGRWRRLVPSPAPRGVVEIDSLRTILADGILPVCGGGGGVPVIGREGRLLGCDAVVDKDATSALLATGLDADVLLLLTDVAAVERDHGTPAATPVDRLAATEARAMVASGEAAAGSMGPKLAAAVDAAGEGRTAIIARIGCARDALAGRAGTRVTADS